MSRGMRRSVIKHSLMITRSMRSVQQRRKREKVSADA
jgi:hypothetical protein